MNSIKNEPRGKSGARFDYAMREVLSCCHLNWGAASFLTSVRSSETLVLNIAAICTALVVNQIFTLQYHKNSRSMGTSKRCWKEKLWNHFVLVCTTVKCKCTNHTPNWSIIYKAEVSVIPRSNLGIYRVLATNMLKNCSKHHISWMRLIAMQSVVMYTNREECSATFLTWNNCVKNVLQAQWRGVKQS